MIERTVLNPTDTLLTHICDECGVEVEVWPCAASFLPEGWKTGEQDLCAACSGAEPNRETPDVRGGEVVTLFPVEPFTNRWAA